MAGQSGSSGSAGAAGSEGVPFAYVGGTDGNITIYRFDRSARTLTFSEEIDAGDYPSFLAVDPGHRFLYAVLEGTAEVAAFAINQTTGSLTPLNQMDAGGNSPAHVSVDKSGRWVLVANYSGGNVRVFPIESDGSLGSPTATPSPGTNPHLIVTDRDNRFAFVPCKGSDLVAQYVFDEANGTLTPNGTPSVDTASGAGPRHLAFSPDGRFAYLINELDDTMTALQYDTEEGVLTPLTTLSTLPMGTSGGNNTTAEVAVHPNGGFVYGSNRGHDSIVVYRVDGLTGTLTLAGHDSSGGETPRHFSIDDTGTVMLVANRNTNNVVVFDIDETTGRLSEVSEVTGVEEPEFAAIVVLPGS